MNRAQPLAREPEREKRFLEHAASAAGNNAFVNQASERLEQGEREFGDRWTRMTLSDFLRELQEEAADIGAWGTLAEQLANHQQLPAVIDRHIRTGLLEIAKAGARAHRAAAALQRVLDHANEREAQA